TDLFLHTFLLKIFLTSQESEKSPRGSYHRMPERLPADPGCRNRHSKIPTGRIAQGASGDGTDNPSQYAGCRKTGHIRQAIPFPVTTGVSAKSKARFSTDRQIV